MEIPVRKRLATASGMQKGCITKYQSFPPIELPERQWPSRTLTAAPTWCSVDLRDGNQALPIPMGVEEKMEMFKLLVGIGFKEIEVGRSNRLANWHSVCESVLNYLLPNFIDTIS